MTQEVRTYGKPRKRRRRADPEQLYDASPTYKKGALESMEGYGIIRHILIAALRENETYGKAVR